MKALVIGGTGPTGPYIVQGLAQRGYEPVILHRGTHETDLGVDVEHIHADPHFSDTLGAALGSRQFDIVVATYGRLRLFLDVLRDTSDRLVTIGGSAYADTAGRSADEDSPRRTEGAIFTKIVQTEEALRQAHSRGDFNITHLRYPVLYGPRQLAPREWSVIRRIRDGRPFIPLLDGGLSLESRAYVENAAHAVLLAVDHPQESAGQQYNVADEYTAPDIVRAQAIAEAMGADVDFVNFPVEAGAPAYWWGSNRDINFAREGRAPETHHMLISIDKLKRELGYSDAVEFTEAIRRTVTWYEENPLEYGGRAERQIGDPFDYEAEDAYRRALEDFVAATREIPFAGIDYEHPYAHPKKPASAAR